jgi:3-methyladenine DNA glycosylase/8-oxoguanine DNA glycosylase
MGKTLPPFSALIEAERRRWVPFKRSLPKADQVIFDKLFDCAKLHIQAGVMVSRPWPFETIVMASMLEQQKQLERAQRLLEELQSRSQA